MQQATQVSVAMGRGLPVVEAALVEEQRGPRVSPGSEPVQSGSEPVHLHLLVFDEEQRESSLSVGRRGEYHVQPWPETIARREPFIVRAGSKRVLWHHRVT